MGPLGPFRAPIPLQLALSRGPFRFLNAGLSPSRLAAGDTRGGSIMLKRIFAFLVLSFAFLGTQCWAQSPPSNCVLPEEGSAQVCSFDTGPGQNSAVATFDCTSTERPCPTAGAHSIKFTVGNVNMPFTITVSANKVTGDGVCDSPGVPDGTD